MDHLGANAAQSWVGSSPAAVERSKPAIRDHWNEVQNQLRETRDILQSALNRLRGPSATLGREAAGASQPDPDHIVFLGQQTAGLASEVTSLARDLADYI